MRVKYYRIGKIELKNTKQRKMGEIDNISLLPLFGVYHRQPILHMSQIYVYLYTTDELIFNPTLHINKVFREHFEKWFRDTFHTNTMEGIKLL